jgi:hypothetical protein
MWQWPKIISLIIYHLIVVIVVALMWIILYKFNHEIFGTLEVSSLTNVVFLPSGIRLISTLLLKLHAVIGLFIGGLITNLHPEITLENTIIISLISAVNPYMAYLSSNAMFNIKSSLATLTSMQLLFISLIYALFNSISHNIFFYLSAITDEFLINVLKMFTGDFIGSILLLTICSVVYSLFRKPAYTKNHTEID